jgi:hypothetical protein
MEHHRVGSKVVRRYSGSRNVRKRAAETSAKRAALTVSLLSCSVHWASSARTDASSACDPPSHAPPIQTIYTIHTFTPSVPFATLVSLAPSVPSVPCTLLVPNSLTTMHTISTNSLTSTMHTIGIINLISIICKCAPLVKLVTVTPPRQHALATSKARAQSGTLPMSDRVVEGARGRGCTW